MTLRLAALALALAACTAPEPRLLYDKRSEFNHVLVDEDARGVRFLRFERGGAVQSAGRPGDPGLVELPYVRGSLTALGLVPKPSRILVIGLGGGTLPTLFRARLPGARIDAVELDPEVLSVAKRYFGFKEDERLRAFVGDGRKFLEGSTEKYDLIFVDAYGKDSAPVLLATAEFLALVRGHLAEGGVAVGNVWSGRTNRIYPRMIRTWFEEFPGFAMVKVPDSSNRIFLGRLAPLTAAEIFDGAMAMDSLKLLPVKLAPIVEQSGACEPDPVGLSTTLRDREFQ